MRHSGGWPSFCVCDASLFRYPFIDVCKQRAGRLELIEINRRPESRWLAISAWERRRASEGSGDIGNVQSSAWTQRIAFRWLDGFVLRPLTKPAANAEPIRPPNALRFRKDP
jgi:hypothetical protein